MDSHSNHNIPLKSDTQLGIIDAQKSSFNVLDQDEKSDELIGFISDLASKTEGLDSQHKVADIQLKIKQKQYCLEKDIETLAAKLLNEGVL